MYLYHKMERAFTSLSMKEIVRVDSAHATYILIEFPRRCKQLIRDDYKKDTDNVLVSLFVLTK